MLDLVGSSLAAVTGEDQLDQLEMVGRGQLAQAVNLGNFACENMALGNRLKGLGGEGQIHGVACFLLEIYREPSEDGVHGLDPAKAPAFVHAKPTVGQLHQAFDVD